MTQRALFFPSPIIASPAEGIAVKVNITWKGRHLNLKASNSCARKVAAVILLALGATLATATAVVIFTFTAKLAVIITVSSVLATTSLAFFTSGGYFLRSSSHMSAAKRIQLGQAAVMTIENEKLTYVQIRQRFGTQIDKYCILEAEDLNILVRPSLQDPALGYAQLIEQHSEEFLKILDETNRNTLREKFFDFITCNGYPRLSLHSILTDHALALKELQIDPQDLVGLFMKNAREWTYPSFKSKIGNQFFEKDWGLTSEGRFFPPALLRKVHEALRDKFTAHIKSNVPVHSLREFRNDIEFFELDEKKLILELMRADLDQSGEEPIGILQSVKNYRNNGLLAEFEALVPQFREKFLSALFAADNKDLVSIENYGPELEILQITDDMLSDTSIDLD